MKIKHTRFFAKTVSLGLVAVAMLVVGTSASAAVVINAIESGGHVVFSFSGSVDLTGATSTGGTAVSSVINPGVPLVDFGGTLSDSYNLANGNGTTFGTSGAHFASIHNTGDIFVYVGSATPRIEVPDGYVSGNALSGSMTFNNATFASLGITPGTYVWDMKLVGTGTVDQNVTLNVVPEPSKICLLGFVSLGLALMRRRCLDIA